MKKLILLGALLISTVSMTEEIERIISTKITKSIK